MTGVVTAIVSMALLGNLLGFRCGSRRLGHFGLVVALTTTGLAVAELPDGPTVGLLERIFVLCVSAWMAALGLLLLHSVGQRPGKFSGARECRVTRTPLA